MLTRRTIIGTGLAAGALGAAGGAVAQDFPRRPIQIIVPANAGGPTDVAARILAAIMEKDIGQSVVVVNKPGAGSQLGVTEIARARPDGYTVGFINMPGTNTLILDPARKAAFTVDSFTFIINHVLDPGAIWVKPDSPFKTLADLVDAAKREPRKLSACTTGILSDDHLAILMLEEASGARFRAVHFDGAAQQLTAVLGGHVDAAFDNVGSVRKRQLNKEVRVLAVTDKQRSKLMPDVPCTAELGFPAVVSSSTRGIAGPKGIPQPVQTFLQNAFKKAMENPDHMQKMTDAGLDVRVMVGDEFRDYFVAQHAIAKKYIEWSKTVGAG